MPRVLALKILPDSALAVVVHSGDGRAIGVETVRRITLVASDGAAVRGRAIAEALSELRLGRTPTVLIVPRSEITVQTFDLPPAPAEDLPDLVHLQAQRDLALPEDGLGFDFLPLQGSDQAAYRVLGVGVSQSLWSAVRETCDAADLKVERIVPEPLGWLDLGRRVGDLSEGTGLLCLFAAIIGRQAVVWATEGDALRLVRTVWLPEDDNAIADAAALGGELRRTLLALAQSHPEHRAAIKCVYIGENADEIAGELGATLSKPVHAAALEGLIDAPSLNWHEWPLAEVAPMAALAAEALVRRTALIDLLHPRRRPAPPSRIRTYALSGMAATLLIGSLAWAAYRNVNSPLEAAEAARVEQEALAPQLASLAEDEAKAAAVRRWLGESINLLSELDHLSQQLRPQPLGDEEFNSEEDVVLTKMATANRQITLEAAARSTEAIQPTERRLRAASYRVDRGPVTAVEGIPGYTIKVTDTVQRVEEPAPAEGGAP